MKYILLLIAMLLLGACASAKIRSVSNQALGDVESGNLVGLVEMMDRQTEDVREGVFAENPDVRSAYDSWQAMTTEEREAQQKKYRLESAGAPPPEPEAIFSQPMPEVHAKLIEMCATSNLSILEVNPNMIVCGGAADFGSALAHALFSPQYSTSPDQRFRFVLYQTDGMTKVRASGWVESQSAFGQTNRSEMTGAQRMRQLRQMLVSIGGE